jgi:hypothetical protein
MKKMILVVAVLLGLMFSVGPVCADPRNPVEAAAHKAERAAHKAQVAAEHPDRGNPDKI